ncbi:MAG: hypothetical protein LUQ04_05815 [Methanoregula sp.]|nr:hypothetical protein [Methanoregula sp.]
MRGLIKLAVLITLFLLCIQTASAMSVASVSIDPSGSLTPNTPVSVSFKIEAGDFPNNGEIQFFTDLDDAIWTYTVIVNGIEVNQAPGESGHNLAITGFLLSYKTNDEVSVRVTLEGVAPNVTKSSDKILVRVTEIDGNNKPVTSSQVEKTALVVNTGEVTSTIESSEVDLQVYRTHIDEKAALGVDTSAAEAKYNEAQQKIDSARTRSTSEYAEVTSDLTAAKTAIENGEIALEMAWAQNEVAAAQVPINNVDAIIGWFKGNTSTANDQQLSSIIAKREVAVGYISNANDNIADGKYAQARQKAQDAFLKANESYTEALSRQKQLSSGFSLPIPKINSTVGIIIAIIAVILVVVGVIIYRKRSQWDELG